MGKAMNKVLLDTNIILDAFMSREPFREAAEQIILLGAAETITICLTANQITDIYYLLYRYKRDEARAILKKILQLFEILPITAMNCWKAYELEMKDYEDALIIASMMANKVSTIITRNLKDFKDCPAAVTVYDPIGFIDSEGKSTK